MLGEKKLNEEIDLLGALVVFSIFKSKEDSD